MSFTKVAAHRGYKAKYAENTLAAFAGAVEVGADIIETDIQLTKEGIVVLNHDPTTGRVYDQDLVIDETSLDDLKQLTNTSDPTQRILSLAEFLEWFVKQPNPKLQVMLDIKPNNDVTVIAKIIRELLNVNDDYQYWYPKVIFGLWKLDFYQFGVQTTLLANFPIVNITISPTIARVFTNYSETVGDRYKLHGVSVLNISLYAPEFKALREDILKPNDIKLYIWTSNTLRDFEHALFWGAYGVVTDKPSDAIDFSEQAQNNTTETQGLLHNGSKFETPSSFSKEGLSLNLKFALFRVFEFLVLNNLLTYRPIQKFVIFLVKLTKVN